MLSLVHCTNCNKTGTFKITLSVVVKETTCGTCNHLDQRKWKYFFCDTQCHIKWTSNNDLWGKGYPCQDCCDITGAATGFAFGFASNGVCQTCNGDKRIKI